MKRKEQYADEIIEMLERTKSGAWASNINLNTKDRVIEVCQNCVDSWSGRKFKDHCTTSPQALEQTRWIPVSERLPEPFMFVNATCRSLIDDREDWVVETMYLPIPKEHNPRHYSNWGNIPMLNWGEAEVIAWVERIIPQPYKAESEVQDETCD